jgi:hypothetical protein
MRINQYDVYKHLNINSHDLYFVVKGKLLTSEVKV